MLTLSKNIFTIYPDTHRSQLENLNYDLLKKDLFETTISSEMKKAYQHYVDKQAYI